MESEASTSSAVLIPDAASCGKNVAKTSTEFVKRQKLKRRMSSRAGLGGFFREDAGVSDKGGGSHCDVCGKLYGSILALKIHKSNTHGIGNGYSCRICGETFATPYAYRMHRATHSSDTQHIETSSGAKHTKIQKKMSCVKNRKTAVSLDLGSVSVPNSPETITVQLTEGYLDELGEQEDSSIEVPPSQYTAGAETAVEMGKNVNVDLSCMLCDKVYKSNEGLFLHQARAHGIGTMYECSICKAQFPRPSRVSRHMREVHKTTSISPCNDEPMETEVKYEEGLEEMDEDSGAGNNDSFACTVCNKISLTFVGLRHHRWLIHGLGRGYSCKICGARYSQTTMLRQHIATHARRGSGSQNDISSATSVIKCEAMPVSPDVEGQMVMNTIEYSTVDVENDSSKMMRTGKTAKPCHVCEKLFISARGLEIHMSTAHGIGNGYSCIFCDETFASPYALRKHKAKHSTNSKNVLINRLPEHETGNRTDSDNVAQNDGDSMSETMSIVMESENITEQLTEKDFGTPYECGICRAQFPWPYRLRRHMKNNHKTISSSKFSGMQSMREIKGARTATELRKVVKKPCSLCPRVCRTTDGLVMHRTMDHGVGKLYKCGVCKVLFLTPDRARYHLKFIHKMVGSTFFTEVTPVNKSCAEKVGERSHGKPENTATPKRQNDVAAGASATNSEGFSCALCSQCFSTTRGLCYHKWQIHGIGTGHTCNICGTRFAQLDKFQIHMAVHTRQGSLLARHRNDNKSKMPDANSSAGNSENDITPCDQKLSTTESQNDAGVDAGGIVSASVSCPQCNRCFFTHTGLRYHNWNVHGIGTGYTCSVCGMRFAQLTKYQNHVEVHTRRRSILTSDGSEKGRLKLDENCAAGNTGNRDRIVSNPEPKASKAANAAGHNTSSVSHKVCDDCGEICLTSSTLRQHRVRAHGLKTGIQCEVCGRQFAFKSQLGQHFRKVHETTVKPKVYMPCALCKRVYHSMEGLYMHRSRIHGLGRLYKCSMCTAMFGRPSRVTRHLKEVHSVISQSEIIMFDLNGEHASQHNDQEDTSIDTQSSQSTATVKSVRKEMSNAVHAPAQKYRAEVKKVVKTIGDKHICAICNRHFYCLILLKQHLLSHSGTKLYSCRDCNKSFHFLCELRKHQIQAHKQYQVPKQPATVSDLLMCEDCGMSCISEVGLRRHRKASHGERVKYTCSTCGKTFYYRHKLTRHIRQVHKTTAPIKCERCDVFCDTREQLDCHTQQEHTSPSVDDNVRHKVCNDCGKICWTASTLWQHMVSAHGVETGIQCEVCDRQFAFKSQLSQHFRKVHERAQRKQLEQSAKQQQQFGCCRCGQLFGTENEATTHFRYTCPKLKNS